MEEEYTSLFRCRLLLGWVCSSGSLVIITASVTRRETAGSWNSFETDGFLLCVRVSKKSHSVDFSEKHGVDVTPVSAARRRELIGA